MVGLFCRQFRGEAPRLLLEFYKQRLFQEIWWPRLESRQIRMIEGR